MPELDPEASALGASSSEGDAKIGSGNAQDAEPSIEELLQSGPSCGDGRASSGLAFTWQGGKNEAHGVDCVLLTLPLPLFFRAKQVKPVLSTKRLRVHIGGRSSVDEAFAEEAWLSLEDSS